MLSVIFKLLGVVCNFLRLQVFHKVLENDEKDHRKDASSSLMCDWDKIKYLVLKTNCIFFFFWNTLDIFTDWKLSELKIPFLYLSFLFWFFFSPELA